MVKRYKAKFGFCLRNILSRAGPVSVQVRMKGLYDIFDSVSGKKRGMIYYTPACTYKRNIIYNSESFIVN